MDAVTEILNGALPSEQTLEQLAEKVRKNPYCAAYQMAWAKMLYHYRPDEYEARLSKLSIYAPSRRWLWEFVHQMAENVPEEKPLSLEFADNSETVANTADIQPVAEEKNDEEDKHSATEEGEFFSETLAKIYIKQKKYERAIKIFEKLSLKYPEKSIYFEDQIRFLRIIIENNK